MKCITTIFLLCTAVLCSILCSFPCVARTANDVIVRKRSVQSQPCSMCSRLGTTLIEENDISDLLPNATCRVAEDFLNAFDESSVWCFSQRNLLENKCCDQSSFPETYECASNIRSMLFNDYDTYVAPVQTNKDKNNMRTLEMGVNINFLAVKTLDVKTSTLELYLDVTLAWNDPRLKWDVNETYCAGIINARASPSVEETELWVPTLDVQNRGSSLKDLTGPPAIVSNDGDGTFDFSLIFRKGKLYTVFLTWLKTSCSGMAKNRSRYVLFLTNFSQNRSLY